MPKGIIKAILGTKPVNVDPVTLQVRFAIASMDSATHKFEKAVRELLTENETLKLGQQRLPKAPK